MIDTSGSNGGSPPQVSDDPPADGLAPSGHRRQLSPAEAAAMEEKVRKVELVISMVLRVGVLVSVLIIMVGLGLMFAHHPAYRPIHGRFSYRELTSKTASFPDSFSSMGRSISRGSGQGIVVLGVLVLILTPVLRVAVGVLSFVYEKDPPMTIVTLYVLVVLVGSFFLAGV